MPSNANNSREKAAEKTTIDNHAGRDFAESKELKNWRKRHWMKRGWEQNQFIN